MIMTIVAIMQIICLKKDWIMFSIGSAVHIFFVGKYSEAIALVGFGILFTG